MQVRCLSHSFWRPYQTRNCDELLSQLLLLLLFFFFLLLLLLLLRQCVACLAMAQSGTVSTASPSPSKADSDSLKCLPWPNAFWNWNVSVARDAPLATLCGGCGSNASAYLAVNASSAALGFGRWPRPDDCVLQIVAGAAAQLQLRLQCRQRAIFNLPIVAVKTFIAVLLPSSLAVYR